MPELTAEDMTGSWKDASALVSNDVSAKLGMGTFFNADRLASTWARVAVAQDLDPAALDPEAVVDRSFLAD